MIRRLLALGLVLIAAPLASACQHDWSDRCVRARDPRECTQVAAAGGDVNDYLTYGMAGYMLSSAVNGAGQRQPVIIADPHYYGYRRPIASYQASPAFVHRSTVTTVTTKRGLFGGTHTTVRSTSTMSRPSPTYRSSYSSFSSYRPSSSYRSSTSSFSSYRSRR